MPYTIILKQMKNTGSKVILNRELAEKLGIEFWKSSILRFGFKTVEVEIQRSKKVEADCIKVSTDLVEQLSLPIECSFEVKAADGELHLGPFIGILAAKEESELKTRFKWLTNYVREYDRIRGTIFAFSFESIDKKQMMVKGYLYDPLEKKWYEKTVPLPAALYINARLDKKEREYLRSIYGSRLFNYRILSKWDIHQILSKYENLMEYLPETHLYDAPDKVTLLLDKYESVYLKPLAGHGGKGVMKLTVFSNHFLLQYREKGNNINMAFMDKESLESYLLVTLEEQEFLIQQGLELSHIENKICDFRVSLNRDQHGDWKISGLLARTGYDNSVVSNYSSGGSVEPFETLVKNHFNFNNQEVLELQESIYSISYKILDSIKNSGHDFGKLAFDIAIDKHLRLWIIEINNRSPDDFLFARAGNRDTTYQIKLDNMLYAKWLAGFGVKKGNPND